MQVSRTRVELASARAELHGSVALVPTMGALHAGHDANIELAKKLADHVVVSIFVNPMQFEQNADLQRYPRVIEADLRRCEELGVDLVWAPDVSDVYPDGPVQVAVTAPQLGRELEGAARPGHFDGVLTVVAKLFGLIRPDQAVFGEKDYQQLMLVRQMVDDLELGVAVHGVATVRDPDGLALSSRNVYLASEQRRSALAIPAALAAAKQQSTAEDSIAAARGELANAEDLTVDYVQVRGPGLGPVAVGQPARLLVAAWVGGVRLIDNCALELPR